MNTTEVHERVGIARDKENVSSLTEERTAYLEGLVSQARTAAAVFTQYSSRGRRSHCQTDGAGGIGTVAISGPPGD